MTWCQQTPIQRKLGAKVPAKSSNLNFEGYFLEFVRMEIWYKLKYTHSWFGTRKNMRQYMYHFIILTHVTNLLDGYFFKEIFNSRGNRTPRVLFV
jgi:hypothetical protein